ncbi:hypothetical protein [Chitinophaga filiformis]|uniref:AraC-type arabinose-binding/dimerisation domain-containing protein n=1 Tax=Chitinophaga filiformis TaxID=104663 RepID=A0ABY4I8T0_CHIFI|nr:hypothetical protein [Chitinophaga filiformis]UPK72310.1 hypothetical protein MYF79_13530 [Chitinophaga filiformis]
MIQKITMQENNDLTIRCYTSANLLEEHLNDDAYQIFQLVSGTGFVFREKHLSFLAAGDLIFIKPGSSVAWSLSCRSILHCCKVSPLYFEQYPYMTKLFKQDSIFNFRGIISNLPRGQAATIGMLFKMIRDEVEGIHDDKKDAILIYLQMLLLLANRVGHTSLEH